MAEVRCIPPLLLRQPDPKERSCERSCGESKLFAGQSKVQANDVAHVGGRPALVHNALILFAMVEHAPRAASVSNDRIRASNSSSAPSSAAARFSLRLCPGLVDQGLAPATSESSTIIRSATRWRTAS